MTHPYLVAPPIAFAHRGGAWDFPENTLRAFQAALDLGYRYLETDVHVTVDGALVAFHDDVLDRVTDQKGKIAALRWSQIQGARVGGTEPIPLFEELLEAFPDARFNVDPKSDGAVDPLIQLIERTKCWERLCIGSFSDQRLKRIRGALGPRICTSLGPLDVTRLRLASFGLSVGGFPGQCVQVPAQLGPLPVVDRRFVNEAHGRGLQVHVWTIDEPSEMERLLDLGVDGIMTDRLEVLRGVFEARGVWGIG